MRTIVLILGVVAALALLHSFTGAPPLPPEGKAIVNVWHPWLGDQGDEFRRLVDVYNKSQDRIHVRLLFIPNNLSSNQKFFLSVCAGMPPDATFVDGPQVCEWAARGAIEPLDDLMAQYGVRNEDFWEPCVRQSQFHGKTYGVTYCADPNFAFFWNRELFREAGYPDQAPPRTIEELDRLTERLTTFNEDGRIMTIGFFPWNTFGYANSIFTWGWAFGGEFYDDKAERVTCGDDPRVVEAMEWMKSYADKYGFEKIQSFAEGFGDQADNPFIRRKIAMNPGHISQIPFFKKYAPDLDYGAGAMPYPERLGEDHSAWVGGWCMAIPQGSRHPGEAFEFIKWLCTSPEAGRSMVVTTGVFPGYKASPAFELAEKDERLRVFYEVLRNTRHQRPVMPAQAFYMGSIERAVVDVLNGIVSPKDGMMRAQRETQKELDRVLRTVREREGNAAGDTGES